MLGNIKGFFKKFGKKEEVDENTKDAAKERLHLVLMQDRANVSADFLEMMKQEIIDVIKKYVDVDEEEIDVRLTNQINDDGSNGAPALYANIPIKGINNETKGAKIKEAEMLEVTVPTVYTWVKRYEENGIKGLETHPGQGRKPIMDCSDTKTMSRAIMIAFL